MPVTWCKEESGSINTHPQGDVDLLGSRGVRGTEGGESQEQPRRQQHLFWASEANAARFLCSQRPRGPTGFEAGFPPPATQAYLLFFLSRS
ncbi:hypothetical protein CEXT_239641 [Caerostris extrusa]|uniref:Uncharacterized protein n=1 Tax=Caerostris extrusa TaxID=172846 RepID=A0AAV4PW32_CAEEX|nr:hypothetical protein CEXT_239641 [Caerostris extrusa]